MARKDGTVVDDAEEFFEDDLQDDDVDDLDDTSDDLDVLDDEAIDEMATNITWKDKIIGLIQDNALYAGIIGVIIVPAAYQLYRMWGPAPAPVVQRRVVQFEGQGSSPAPQAQAPAASSPPPSLFDDALPSNTRPALPATGRVLPQAPGAPQAPAAPVVFDTSGLQEAIGALQARIDGIDGLLNNLLQQSQDATQAIMALQKQVRDTLSAQGPQGDQVSKADWQRTQSMLKRLSDDFRRQQALFTSYVQAKVGVPGSEDERASLVLEAVVPGRAWLRSPDGLTQTVAVGDFVRGYGRVVRIDAVKSQVITSSGQIIRE